MDFRLYNTNTRYSNDLMSLMAMIGRRIGCEWAGERAHVVHMLLFAETKYASRAHTLHFTDVDEHRLHKQQCKQRRNGKFCFLKNKNEENKNEEKRKAKHWNKSTLLISRLNVSKDYLAIVRDENFVLNTHTHTHKQRPNEMLYLPQIESQTLQQVS